MENAALHEEMIEACGSSHENTPLFFDKRKSR